MSEQIKYAQGVFLRHVGDRSVVWCPHSSGCTVMRDVQPFLEEIGWDWRDVERIKMAIAAKFECVVAEIEGDFKMVLGELISQGFVECEGSECVSSVVTVNWRDNSSVNEEVNGRATRSTNDDDPLGIFCKCHNLAAELHIDLTDACTERCVHCYVPKGQTDFLPVDLVEKALVEFRAMNGLTVHLTGGEPMMHPDFERICRKCVELNLNFIIFSNMTLCNDDRIAFLKEVAPQFINVSLYSMKPEEHDAITQLTGSWHRTMDAMLKCCEAGVACRIATPILKENQDALPALRKFADEYHMHLVPAADIVALADHGCKNLAHACSKEELRRVFMRNHDLFTCVYSGVIPARSARVCDIGTRGRIYLNAKGNYYPCDSMHEYVLGNVCENALEEVWNGEKLNYLRGLKNSNFGVCASCEKRPWCKVCPAANFNATRDLFKHHPSTCALAEVIREVYGKAVTLDA